MKTKKIPDAMKSGHEIMKEEAEKLGIEILDYYPDPLPARRGRKQAASRRRTAKVASRNGRSRRSKR